MLCAHPPAFCWSPAKNLCCGYCGGERFDEHMWAGFRKCQARYKPRRVAIEGNHYHRLTRALETQPDLSP
jgi:hypothetical protein